ncbi:MAG: NAD(P)/FAD-dependent oxidoreductase [Deltaproteobacteria bacterium]|nr:NAD(P)/FAD-dependent oxidoreductase [Deltaproteobacteria bacterium]
MSNFDLDLIVIGGGGSGGFTAATTAMKTGAKVGMAEAGRLGGLCMLAGCMPSKTLLHSAAQIKAQGVNGMAAYPTVHQFTRAVVNHLAGGRVESVEAKQKQGLQLFRGAAHFVDPHTVEVDGQRVSAAKIVIATGSEEAVPPVPGLAESGYLDSDAFMKLPELPESLLVLGGGTQAVELAQVAARMGVKTTVVQRSAHLVSKIDPRFGHILAESLSEDGATVYTGTELREVRREDQTVTAVFTHQGKEVSVSAQALLLSLGRRPHTRSLNLKAAGVDTGIRGEVLVDRCMQTSQKHIFAAGDVTGWTMVVNLAVLQGRTAGYNATHETPREIDDRVLPTAIFTDPQFAQVGLSLEQAQAAGLDCLEADYDLGEMSTAKTYPERIRGYMSLRGEKGSGRIVGAEVVAPEASLMIHDMAVAIKMKATASDIASIPYIHPSLAEISEFTAGRLAKMLRA